MSDWIGGDDERLQTVREELHRLVDVLSAGVLPLGREFLIFLSRQNEPTIPASLAEALAHNPQDRLLRALLSAPVDIEPESVPEAAASLSSP